MTLIRKYVFCHFPDFTYFERVVTLLLVKIILNFKNCKTTLVQALFKLFRKMKSSCPKRCVNASTAPDFCHGSVYQQRMSGGGGV